MTTAELLGTNKMPTEEEARLALTNNICRCTGYNNIVKAVLEAAVELNKRTEMGSD